MPNTVNLGLNIANTGDNAGSWGTTVVNANMVVVDGISCGSQSISLTGSSATTLSIATGVIGTGSLTPGAGPTQSANRIITFSGTLSANCVVTMPRPGSWIVKNGCTVGSFYVQARAVGTGNLIGLPPGEFVEVLCDGTNVAFVGLDRVGSYTRMAVTTTPAWMTACTVQPYLPCNSTTTYPVSTYPALAAMLGSTFGGNGITTFAVPDKSNKVGVPIGSLLTSGNCGFDGSVLGASGGTTAFQAHTHAASVADPSHGHPARYNTQGSNGLGSASGGILAGNSTQSNFGAYTGTLDDTLGHQIGGNTTGITVSNGTTGSGSSGNVQPTIIDGIEFIRTG